MVIFKCLNTSHFIQTIFKVFRQHTSFKLRFLREWGNSFGGIESNNLFQFYTLCYSRSYVHKFWQSTCQFQYLMHSKLFFKNVNICIECIEISFKIICYLSILSTFNKDISDWFFLGINRCNTVTKKVIWTVEKRN